MVETKLISKEYLRSYSRLKLSKFLACNFGYLIGGQVFTIGNTKLTKTIQKITKKYAKTEFVPVHVGQIVNIGCKLFVINVTPPKVEYTELMDYILETDEDFKIIYRGSNFTLDTARYSAEVCNMVGKEYGYFSALQSGIKALRWIPNRKTHCSEATVMYLQNQGYFKDYVADDMTPVEVYDIMISGNF